jgi:LuxR family maltose regulon positive regulatory protein
MSPEKIEKAKKNNTPGLYYFPDRLRKSLAMIPRYPVTVVEALSGFGKTTAVREYLKENLLRHSREYWHICLGEPSSRTWEGICWLFEESDPDVAAGLKELGPPTMETLADVAALVRGVRVDKETFLVVDNYQLFENEIRREIINAFSVHGSENLHIIFITQPLSASKESVHYASIHRLDNGDFLFDRDSTARLCRLFGIKLPEKDWDYIYNVSEGWIAVIRLQVENYKKTGSFAYMRDMDNLIETAIWNRTSENDRKFLMAVSLLDGFTPQQAAVMLNAPSLPPNAEDLLRQNVFIPYSEEGGAYYMHALLRNFLRKRFENAPDDFRFEILRRAGDACASAGDYFSAASFYRRAEDFSALFSLPFTSRYLNSQKEAGIMKFVAEVLSECPDDMLAGRPFVALAFAFQFLVSGMRLEFSRMLGIIQRFVSAPPKGGNYPSGDTPESDLNRIKGEFALLTSFTCFNDIERMSAHHREALEYLGSKGAAGGYESPQASVTFGTTPWTFGITSVLYLFWSGRGELEKELCSMDDCMPHYTKLTGGHGAGADSVMRAEAMLLRGDDVESEILYHRAIYMARSENQSSICLCAELILARIAVLRGDSEGYLASMDNIRRYADEGRNHKPITRMAEMCFAATSLSLGIPDDVADWLRDADKIRETLYIQGLPYGHILYGACLVRTKRWSEVFGLSDAAEGMAVEMNYLLPQVYWNIYRTVACLGMKRSADESGARKYLARALELALPDRVYLPFAEYGSFILPILEQVRRGKDFDAERMDALIALCRRQISGTEAVNRSLSGKETVLTPRQREIAMLMRERFSTKEIASALFIAESTVKSAQKIIYDKLNVHSKRELAKIEL